MGGAEIQVLSLIEGLRQRNHATAFLGTCPTLLQECSNRGIIAAELPIGPPPVSKLHALTFAWRKQKMKRQLEAALNEFGSLDAIVMVSLTEKILLTPLALKKGIAVYWLEHDKVGRWLRQNPWLGDLKKMSSSVTTIVVSDLSKKIYEDLGWPADRVVAIANGIDSNRFTKKSKDPSDKLIVGTVSRLSPEKGLDVLISAFSRLDNAELYIVGKGRQEKEIRTLIAPLADRVHLTDRIENLGSFYSQLDVFILPSTDHDPFGLVAAEAMMLGVPVIVTSQCGIAGYLRDHENALICEPTAEGIFKALSEMQDAALREKIAENGEIEAHASFTTEHMIDAYEKILEKKG